MDLGKESEIIYSIYGFLAEDWLKTLLDKPIKEGRKDINKEEPEKKKSMEGGKNWTTSLGSISFKNILIPDELGTLRFFYLCI